MESQAGASDLLPHGFESETTGQQENPAPESGSSSGAQLPQSGVRTDFMSDRFYDGTRFRTFNEIDHFNREGLAIEVDASLTGQRVIRVLEQLKDERGPPEKIRVDNGPEFTGSNLEDWAKDHETGSTPRNNCLIYPPTFSPRVSYMYLLLLQPGLDQPSGSCS